MDARREMTFSGTRRGLILSILGTRRGLILSILVVLRSCFLVSEFGARLILSILVVLRSCFLVSEFGARLIRSILHLVSEAADAVNNRFGREFRIISINDTIGSGGKMF